MQYTLGYTPATMTEQVQQIESIFDLIDYDNLRVLGAGNFGIVITDGTYAIKFGEIDNDSVFSLKQASMLGYAPKVFYHQRCARINDHLLSFINTNQFHRFGYEVETSNYIINGICDILVTQRVETFIDQATWCDEAPCMDHVAFELQDELARRGIIWDDPHEGNIGHIDGHVVVIDF